MLGIANRNWTNIKQVSPEPWKGSGQAYASDDPAHPVWLIQDKLGHAIFSDPIWSIRATCIQLLRYHQRGVATLPSHIREWLGGDGVEAKVIADYLAGMRVQTDLVPFDGEGPTADLYGIVYGMVRQELYAGFNPQPVVSNGIKLFLFERDRGIIK